MTDRDGSSKRRKSAGTSRDGRRDSLVFWTDTVNKVVMPFATLVLSAAVFAGTTRANHADRQSKAEAQCRDGTMHLLSDAQGLIDFAAVGGARPTGSGAGLTSNNDQLVARAEAIDVGGKFLLQECDVANLSIPENVNHTLCTLAPFVPDTDVKQSLLTTAVDIASQNGSVRSVEQQGASKRTGCISEPTALATPAAPAELTLYLQYPNGMDREALTPFISAIRAQGLAGRKIVVPGAEAVSPPSKSTLRCLKAADCAVATPIAVHLSKMLGNADIQVLNLSRQYEARTDVKPGRLEFWLSSQDAASLPK